MNLPAIALLCSFPVFHPAWHGKVCRFSTVETMIETSMVTEWECDHNFPFFLCDL